jgi:hypothetical protein
MLRNYAVVGALALLCPTCCASVDDAKLEHRIEQLENVVDQLQHRIQSLESARSAPASSVASTPGALQSPVPQQRAESPAKPANTVTVSTPLKFNGEFFLYFDSITRPAGADTPRASNIRGRYLLHLDLDAALRRTVSVHARLSTGPINNPLTDIQDFGGGAVKHPFSLSEAYVDFHPNQFVRLQGGRVDSPFNDRLRFLFDSDTRFNGTNEVFRVPVSRKPLGITEVQFRAGQYILTNPNLPVIAEGTPSTAASATPSQALLATGLQPGDEASSSALFQQGFVVRQQYTGGLLSDLGFDVQTYTNPNQLRLMSTPGGLFLVGTTTGFNPSSPVPSASNATTTPGGAILTAPGYNIGHLSYTLAHRGVTAAGHVVPLSLNLQYARNLEHVSDRNAWSAIATLGRSQEAGDLRFLYGYYVKEANSLIGELTENDIAIGGNVNMRANMLRVEYTLGRGVVFANNLIWTRWLKDSNPQANFFVPLGRLTPMQFRYQGMLVFRF